MHEGEKSRRGGGRRGGGEMEKRRGKRTRENGEGKPMAESNIVI